MRSRTSPSSEQTPTAAAAPGLRPRRELEAEAPESSEPDPEDDAEAQTPVLLPQALHQDCVSPMANFCMFVTKSLQGSVVSLWPNSGYSWAGVESEAEPFAKRKRTETSSGFTVVGASVPSTVAFVTSSKAIELA